MDSCRRIRASRTGARPPEEELASPTFDVMGPPSSGAHIVPKEEMGRKAGDCFLSLVWAGRPTKPSESFW